MPFKSASDLEEALRVGTVAPEDMVIEPQPAVGLKGGDTPRNLTPVEIAQLRADLQFSGQLSEVDMTPDQLADLKASYESDGVESDMTPEQLQTFVSAEANGAVAEVVSLAQDVSSQVTDSEQNPVFTADALSTERVQDAGVDTAPTEKQETV